MAKTKMEMAMEMFFSDPTMMSRIVGYSVTNLRMGASLDEQEAIREIKALVEEKTRLVQCLLMSAYAAGAEMMEAIQEVTNEDPRP